ncbi:5768_t:CDS:2, partial [Racocetra persica]
MGCISSNLKLGEKIESTDTQSSQTEFRYINGRRFHNVENVKYNLPNDENEIDRLHSQHFLFKYTVSGKATFLLLSAAFCLNQVPKSSMLGSWSFDIATTYPLAKVVGLDISPHQPTTIKPKNFEFVKAN